jgi:hypothetical protein
MKIKLSAKLLRLEGIWRSEGIPPRILDFLIRYELRRKTENKTYYKMLYSVY